jgi:hypothetical protein
LLDLVEEPFDQVPRAMLSRPVANDDTGADIDLMSCRPTLQPSANQGATFTDMNDRGSSTRTPLLQMS